MSYLNEEQADHMRGLNDITPELRCPSGWHVLSEMKCDCARTYGGGYTTLRERLDGDAAKRAELQAQIPGAKPINKAFEHKRGYRLDVEAVKKALGEQQQPVKQDPQ